MNNEYQLDSIPVAGRMKQEELLEKLTEINDRDAASADVLTKGSATANKSFFLDNIFGKRAWSHTAHTFGYVAPLDKPGDTVGILHAGNIAADVSLKNQRIKITLDRLRVADYPGSGTHLVLFDFYAQNQVPGTVEHLHFNNTFRVKEGQQAAVIGFPVFIGLSVGTEGVAFRCFTVNVKNENDEKFLAFLESDIFKSGLQLGVQLQPAIAPLSKMALGITEAIAKRNRNVPVQDVFMGLDFSNIATRARLREGSYIAVQIPESIVSIWDWDEWAFDSSTGQISNKENPKELIPYNYVVFSISKYAGGE